jgi:hypothetical protein
MLRQMLAELRVTLGSGGSSSSKQQQQRQDYTRCIDLHCMQQSTYKPVNLPHHMLRPGAVAKNGILELALSCMYKLGTTQRIR